MFLFLNNLYIAWITTTTIASIRRGSNILQNGFSARQSSCLTRDTTKKQNKYSLKSSPTSGPHSGMCQNRCKINERRGAEGKHIPYLAWHYLLTLRMIISINRLSKPQVGCEKNKGFDCHHFQILTRRCWCTCHSGANNVITRIDIRAFNCSRRLWPRLRDKKEC